MKTKNKFWLIACFLMLFSFAKAGNHVHFMLFGGFNTSHLITEFKDKEIIISQAKQHYNFGAGFRFEFAKIFFIQPEVYFTRKGGLEQAFRPNVTDSFNQQINMKSIDMPIMVGLNFFHSKRFGLRVYGGPVISVLQDQKVNISQNGKQMPWQAKTNVFSTQIGAGIDITRLTFDIRYEYALSPMLTVSDFKTSYRILYFTLGLKLI